MKKLILLFVSALSMFCSACTGSNLPAGSSPIVDASTPVYQKMTAEEAKAILEGNNPFILLDVRTEEEFLENRIEGAVLIPDYTLADRAASELPDQDALILVYCRSGRRSAAAAKKLVDMGYTNVYDFGGIIDWPYETVNG